MTALQRRDKTAKQLSLALEKLPKGVYKRDVAESVPVTPSALSQWANGSRKMANDVLRPLAKFIHQARFNYSGASQDYGILSFKDDGKVKDDLFAATVDQQQQERERIEAQIVGYASLIKPDKLKTSKDQENIDKYLNEYGEEISSELTDYFEKCAYANRNPMDLIEEINKRIGG